ncbi:hypothetical protein QJS66_14235 [Kocuria rhizophila]|nr:hypothetical protein QJS66_14235 [Kocuria rhizophila]
MGIITWMVLPTPLWLLLLVDIFVILVWWHSSTPGWPGASVATQAPL